MNEKAKMSVAESESENQTTTHNPTKESEESIMKTAERNPAAT